MTPTEQDKELREAIKNILNAESLVSVDLNEVTPALRALVAKRYDNGSIDTINQLITADRKRVALEARLDELDTFRIVASIYITKGGNVQGMKNEIENRLAELKAQQEEV